MNPVVIATHVEAELALWRATAELAAVLPRGSWTLVGARMVFLLAYEHDLPIGRTSGDVDLLMNVRALTDATRKASSAHSGETDQLFRSESDHPFRSFRSPQVGGRGRPTRGSGSAPDGHLLSVLCG
jgi:hypothetical protein